MDSNLIHDWNPPAEIKHAQLNDETLRDGLQSPSVRDPNIAQKIEILHLIKSLGINSLNLGLPRRRPARRRARRTSGPRNRRQQNEDSRQLRGPHS